MTVGWNEAHPVDLPPSSVRQKLRLCLRGLWATVCLALLFSVFLLVRCCEMAVGRLRGREERRIGSRIVRFWAMLALPTLGLRYVQHGEPIMGAGAFVANHSSWIDVVALQRAAAPFLVSKSEVRNWPGIGFIGRAIGTLFIDRKAAAAKLQEAELRARLSQGDHMALFPEGTSTDGQRVLSFKSSLFGVFFTPELEGRAFIQPVAIIYRPAEDQPAKLYAWWGEMDFAAHFLAMLGRSVGGVVELNFLEPVRADETTGRKEMALICGQRVRAVFEARRPAARAPNRISNEPDATN